MKKVVITSKLWNDFLIISLSKKWIDMFDKIPQFTVKIDGKNKLIIESLEEVSTNDLQK